jgi:hypothetical protein
MKSNWFPEEEKEDESMNDTRYSLVVAGLATGSLIILILIVSLTFIWFRQGDDGAGPDTVFMRHLRLMDVGEYDSAWQYADDTCPKPDRFSKQQFNDIRGDLAAAGTSFAVEFAPVEVYVEKGGEKALLKLDPQLFTGLQWQTMRKIDGEWKLTCELD